MSGPYILLRDASGQALLAWGSDELVERAPSLGYKAIVLTCAGCMHTRFNPAGVLIERACGYQDRGTAEAMRVAKEAVLRCAPGIAARVASGVPTLITCAAGQNRSALMAARVAHLVSGESGAVIVTRMMQMRPRTTNPPDDGAFSNGVFRRWAQSWPASAGIRQSAGGGLWWGAAATALLLLAWWKWGT